MSSSAPNHQPSTDDLTARLAALGLTPELLVEARGRAQHDVDECTNLDPRTARGSIRHFRTTRYLRELLIPLSWAAEDMGNVSVVVSPDESVAIVVARGDDNTGVLGKTPRTKYPKGAVTHRLVRKNVQLSFFDSPTDPALDDEVDAPERVTWVLLQHPAGDVLRAELSRPSAYDGTGRICEWKERIILPSLELDTYETAVSDDDDVEGDHSADVPVSPR